MKPHLTDDERDDEIMPFIGIPRKWTNPAVKIYAILFLAYSGWVSYQRLRETADPLVERLAGLWAHLAASGFVEGLLLVSLVHIGDIFMYLTKKFMTDVAKIRAEGVKEGRAAGLEQGIEQGLEQGIATAYHQWQAWNTRRMEAEAKKANLLVNPANTPEKRRPYGLVRTKVAIPQAR